MTRMPGVRVLAGRYGSWLTANGQSVLVSSDLGLDDPPQQLLELLAEEGLLTDHSHVYGTTVMMTTRCNLTCSYCYQNESALAGVPVRIPRKTLSPDALGQVRDFIARQMESYDKSALHLLLTGGEPLLQFRSCEQLLATLAPLGLTAAQMFTNAVLLTPERARTLAHGGLTHLQVSFDGYAADHDRYRKDAAGTGSYDKILRNIRQALDVAPQLAITARVNVTASNLDRLGLLLDDIADRVGASSVSLRLGLVDDIGIGFDDAPARNVRTGQQVRDLALAAVDLGFFVEPLASLADCLYCGVIGGGSGSVINSDGTLYSCWESVGRAGYEVGDLTVGYLPADQLTARWVDCSYNVTDRESSRAAVALICDQVDAAVLDRCYERLVPAETLA